MILDLPELLVKVARYADWRAILALQRLNRGAYRDRPALVQEFLWRCAVRSRWPWACAKIVVSPDTYALPGRAWITACGSWRRVYAYLRTVGFTTSASLWDEPKPPSLRVSRTPTYNPRYGLGARNPPLSRVEECAWSEEPLAESASTRPDNDDDYYSSFANVRPGLPAGPMCWVADFTAYAPDAEGLLVGVRTDREPAADERRWYFDIGDHLGERNNARVVNHWELVACDVFKAPVRLRLVVNLAAGSIALSMGHDAWRLHDPDLAAAAASDRLHPFVAFGAMYEEEDDAGYGLPSDVDEWDPWSDHYPERRRRRGYATLDKLVPVSVHRGQSNS